jgi:hypothetical protein
MLSFLQKFPRVQELSNQTRGLSKTRMGLKKRTKKRKRLARDKNL